jgi:hypothetical protein
MKKKRVLEIAEIITWILGFVAIGLLVWGIIRIWIS